MKVGIGREVFREGDRIQPRSLGNALQFATMGFLIKAMTEASEDFAQLAGTELAIGIEGEGM